MLGFHQQQLNTTPDTAESEYDEIIKIKQISESSGTQERS